WAHVTNRVAMSVARDLARAPQQGELLKRLVEAHVRELFARVNDDARALRAETNLIAHLPQRTEEEVVLLAIGADVRVELRRALEELRQLLVELLHQMRLVGPEARLGTVYARAAAGPDLLLLIARPHEERETLVALGGEDEHALGLGET